MTLHEPDVALTDFGLAIECAWFVALLVDRRSAGGRLRTWFVIFFLSIGVGALLGGITHGFVSDHGAIAARALWIATLLAIGAAALACWGIGAHLMFSSRIAKRIVILAEWLFALYAATIIAVSASFAVAVAHYASAGAFMGAAFVLTYRRRRDGRLLAGVAGVALSFVAAAVQQGGIGIRALNLSHNALYHLIQAVALLLIFLAAWRMTREAACGHDANS